jgi:hypothetical protein
MFHELVSAFAGFVLMQVAIFIVGDALGLLGERFEKTRSIANWMADIPEALVSYFFSRTPKYQHKVHLTSKH